MNAKKVTAQKSPTGRATKVCSRCGRKKVYASFNKDKGVKPDGYARQCRVCRLRTQSKSKKQYLRKVDVLKAKISCAKCNENRSYMLDFHHNEPRLKIDSISNMRDKRRPLKEIKAEIKKCTVLCSNCHRELHFKKLTIKQYLKEV